MRLSLTPRSGPIVIEIEYRVDPAKARLFMPNASEKVGFWRRSS